MFLTRKEYGPKVFIISAKATASQYCIQRASDIAMKKQNGNRLKKFLENVAEVKVIPDFENLATLYVFNPQLTIDGKERWETLLLHLTNCEFIGSVAI